MSADTPRKPVKSPMARSRVTNGSKMGANMDGRSTWARRARDLAELYANDMGGSDTLSEMQLGLVKRAAVMTVELERAEEGFAKAGSADQAALSAYQTTVNSLRRLLESLGLQAKHAPKDAKDVEKTIEGIRVTKAFTDNMDLASQAACVGNQAARFDVARRIHFAIRQAAETGGELPPAIAKLAVQLALASYAPDAFDEADPDPAAALDRGVL